MWEYAVDLSYSRSTQDGVSSSYAPPNGSSSRSGSSAEKTLLLIPLSRYSDESLYSIDDRFASMTQPDRKAQLSVLERRVDSLEGRLDDAVQGTPGSAHSNSRRATTLSPPVEIDVDSTPEKYSPTVEYACLSSMTDESSSESSCKHDMFAIEDFTTVFYRDRHNMQSSISSSDGRLVCETTQLSFHRQILRASANPFYLTWCHRPTTMSPTLQPTISGTTEGHPLLHRTETLPLGTIPLKICR